MVLRGILKAFVGAAWLLLIIILILGVGGYFAAKSIDPNIFRTELEKHLTQRTGLRVELGNIQLNWGARLRIQLDGLKFYNPNSLEKLLQSDSVVLEADLTSLIRRKLWLSQIVIMNPEVFIKKRTDGLWNWQPKAGPSLTAQVISAVPEGSGESVAESSSVPETPSQEASGQETVPAKQASPKSFLEFGFGTIEVRDGTIHYADETIQPAYTLQIAKCDVEILPKSLPSAYHGVLNGVIWQATERKIKIEGDADLASQILDFQVQYDQDRALLKGVLKLENEIPNFKGSLQIRKLDLETLVPEELKKGEYMSGILDSDLQISFKGGNPELITQSLVADGEISIVNGALRNRNLVQEVIEKLSPVIEVAGLLKGELPPELMTVIKDPDTEFQKAIVNLSVSAGSMTIRGFSIESEAYQLSGQGLYGLLNREIDLKAALKFSKTISAYFIKKAPEFKALANEEVLVEIPFTYAGTVPDAAVMPDLPYISNRLLQAGAQILIDKGLETLSKLFEPKTAEANT